MRERSRARGWALQILYASEARGGGPGAAGPEEILTEFLEERNVAAESRGYLRDLLRHIGEHRPTLDAALQEALLNWRLDRLSAIDRNILRIAAAEMLYVADVPPRVSIQEAIRLAERFGTAESPRFVNGVLDALMQRLAGAEKDEGEGGGGPA